MKYFSLFSGIGGFELGINQSHEICNANGNEDRGGEKNPKRDKGSGLFPKKRKATCSEKGPACKCSSNKPNKRPLCIGFSEIDKYAIQVYKKHFPNHKNYGDITKINERALPDFDFLVGGFPCQAFSIAGKRGGFADTRGTLFFDIARIIKEKQPRLLLLENVKGLLSHNQGSTFTTIISTLDELGYDCQWQVLNSKNHGVPQNRERVFIVGHLRGTSRPEVFPFSGQSNKNNTIGQSTKTTVARTLTGGGNTGGNHSGMTILKTPPFIQNPKMNDYKKKYQNSVAITASSHKEPPVVNSIRRLTPTECERLQGFPDGWTSGLSDTQRYKCCGNAVTVNVIEDIINRLI